MEESHLKCKGLYCCFIDFKKTFDMVPRDKLWRHMEELGVPSEYMVAISRIYEKLICHVRMDEGLSDYFTSTTGVKRCCPLSPTLFGLCIDELEQRGIKFLKEEGIEEVTLGNVVFMLLLYADEIVHFANNIEDAQKLIRVLEKLCMHSGLSVNSSKSKIMLKKLQNKEKPCKMYNNEPLESVESFKYLALEVPSNHRWNETCVNRRFEVGKRAYYAFGNICNGGEITC